MFDDLVKSQNWDGQVGARSPCPYISCKARNPAKRGTDGLFTKPSELSDVFPALMLSGNAALNQISQEKMGRTNPNPFLGHQIYISIES